MTPKPHFSLWSDLWTDLHDPNLIWQVGVLLLCLAGGWSLARIMRGRFRAEGVHSNVVRWGVESFSYVMAPVFAWILLAIAKPILASWHSVSLLRLALPLCASFALIRLAFYVFRRVFARNGHTGPLVLLAERLFAALVWIGVALYTTGLWPELLQYLNDVELPIGAHRISVLTVSQGLLSIVATLLLALWIGALVEDRLMRLDTVHSSVRVVAARFTKAVLILVAVLLSLALAGIDLTVLSVFGGALGVGIGLGLQKIVSSYVSGFVILLERSLSIGDMVAVDKYVGRVTHIKTRYTILQGLDGIESVVPNELLVSSTVQNYSLSSRQLRLTTHITVAYETDIDVLIPALVDCAAGVERILKTPEPAAILVKFGADGLELEVGFWIDDPENGRMSVVSEVNLAIWRLLQQRNVKVPYPQREIRMLDALDK
jgi:small-conductance mechanosensitive channel